MAIGSLVLQLLEVVSRRIVRRKRVGVGRYDGGTFWRLLHEVVEHCGVTMLVSASKPTVDRRI